MQEATGNESTEALSENETAPENEGQDFETQEGDEESDGFPNPTKAEAKPQKSGNQGDKKQGNEKTNAQKLKELSEQDLDAIVTVKINGKVEKKPVREVLKLAQLGEAATEKFQKASEMNKRAEAAFKLATENPAEFLRRTGKDPYEFAEEMMANYFEEMQLSPQERALRERENRVKQFEEAENSSKQEIMSQIKSLVPEFNVDLSKVSKDQLVEVLGRAQEIHTQEQDSLQNEIVEAWQSTGLPKDKFFGAQIAARMLASEKQMRAGHREKPLTAKEAAAIVKEEWIGNTRRILETMDAQAIQQILGDKIPKTLREFDVKRVTGKQPLPTQKSPGTQPASKKSNKPLSELEWRKQIEEMSQSFKD